MAEVKILSQEEIEKELKKLSGWEQQGDKIIKWFKFKNFMEAVNFTYQLAPVFEKMEHHPDLSIFFDKILFELQSHDAGGKITHKDLETARAIEKNVKQWRKNPEIYPTPSFE